MAIATQLPLNIPSKDASEARKTPRGYQRIGIEFLRSHKRAFNCDSPGLGKTFQATEAAVRPVLVLCPSYLVTQWRDWIDEQYPQESVEAALGTRDERAKAVAKHADWTIMNYEMFHSYVLPHEWYRTIILDESHHVRNHAQFVKPAKSKKKREAERAAQAEREGWGGVGRQVGPVLKFDDRGRPLFDDYIKQLEAKREGYTDTSNSKLELSLAAKIAAFAHKIEYCFLLSATPMKTEADDIWRQLNIIDPNTFSSYYRFRDLYCNVVRTPWKENVTGFRNPAQMRQLFSQYMIRRTYSQAHRELPKVIPQVFKLNASPEWYDKYKKLKKNYTWEDVRLTSASQVLQALRVVTLDKDTGKLEAIVRLADEAVSGEYEDKGAVVFCWYRDTAALLGEALGAQAITGDMPPARRREVALASTTKHVVATIPSLSEGIDLSHHHTVIFAEEHYSPGDMEQALKRVQRERKDDSDTMPIRVFYIHVVGSVDEKIHKVLNRRTGDINDVLREELINER